MKVSIAMTTYNGIKYVEKQLESIRIQTRKPDEVIICDDISSDDTVDFIKAYIKKYSLDGWKIYKNDFNLGWKENFRNAISRTTGDIIFFADQDDIWLEDKLDIMVSCMEEHDIGCLYGKCLYIDAEDNILVNRNEQSEFSNHLSKIKLTPSFFTVGALGCCMAISRKIAMKYLDYNCYEDDHDSQCPRIAVLYNKLWVLDRPVIKYRLHNCNTSGISNECSYGQSNLNQRIKDIKIINNWLTKVLQDRALPDKIRNMAVDALRFQNARLNYFGGKLLFIYLLSGYKYYSGFSMFLGDFAYKHGINVTLGKFRWRIQKFFN